MINESRNKRDLSTRRSKRISGSESQRFKIKENDKRSKDHYVIIRQDKSEAQQIRRSEVEDQRESK